MPGRSSARGTRYASTNGIAVGATGVQPPSESATPPDRPENGHQLDALKPAWASWIAGTAPRDATNAAIGRHASTCAPDQMPASRGEIRPSGTTALASALP